MKSNGYSFYELSARLIGNLRLVGAPVLIGMLSIWLIPEKVGHSDSSRTAPPAALSENQPMPALQGQEAIDHLKQQGDYNSLQEAMAAARYEAQWQTTPKLQDLGAAYEYKNAANNLLAYVNADGLQVTSLNDDQTKPWRLGLKLEAVGYGESLSSIQGGPVTASGNRVSIQKSAIRNPQSAIEEWFINASRGIEHGFTLASRPKSSIGKPQSEIEKLRLRLAVTGDLAASVSGTGAAFSRTSGSVLLSYNKLFVLDAKGRALDAGMKLQGGGLVIEVEDAGAEYPLTIDPLLTQQQKLTASDGAQSDEFGNAVAISADTVVVGALANDSGPGGNQGATYVFIRSGTSWTQQAKLTASDAGAGDIFGNSVAISGDTVVVGAPGNDSGPAGNQGAAYVFTRSGTTWTQQSKLIASDAVGGASFGTSVAISGETVVVGDESGISAKGSAYVFVRSGVSWTQQAKLTSSDNASNDRFGNAVSISGDTVVVGASSDDVVANADQGSASVFVRSGTSWTQQVKLTAGDGAANDEFGNAVSISSDTIVVGAYVSDPGGNSSQGSAYVFVRSGLNWTQQAKLTASDGAANDRFGVSVAITGDTIVVGGDHDSVSGNNAQGSAYVFSRSGTTWAQQQQLTAADGTAGDNFGYSVAISGDTVVAGALGKTVGGNFFQGAAYVFVCTWSEQFHAFASLDGAPGDRFGNAVSISGDTVVVGATLDDTFVNPDQGSAYVFVRSGVNWTQQAKLLASDGAGGDQFGTSVAISGDTIVVGAPFDDILASDQGSAYVFTRSGTTWTLQQKLGANDAAAGDLFGFSVAIAGDTIIIGAFADTVANSHQGSAYVFVTNGTSWTLQQKLTAIDGLTNDFFGYSVAISADTVVVGAATDDEVNPDQGSAYVFVRSGTTWTQQGAKLTANDGGSGDQFGFSVAISGDTLVAGAVHDVINGNQDQGSAYVFVRTGVTWTQQQKIFAADGNTFDQLGVSVAISGDTIVLGAQADDETIPDQGSAYVYQRSGVTWNFRQKLLASDPGNTDLFGFSVAISGNTIVVGAYRDDVAANADQGSAYVFFMGCNTAPVITSGSFARQKGSPASSSTIANVSDSEDPIGYLTVSVASAPAGISITNITNTNGVVTAQVAALCNATLGNNFVVLRVQDSDGAVGSVQLLINITPNAAPTLGVYPNTAVAVLGSTTVTPNLTPSDNGSLVSLSAISQTFTGILSVDLDTGVVSISNARPGGTHVVTVTAVDNCGVATTSGFTLTVNCQSITVNPSTIPSATAGSAYTQVFTQAGGNAPIVFSLSGTLPTGLSFTAATATLSGTPTQVGDFPITVTATDTNNCAGSRNYTLVIGAMSLVWNGSTSADWNTASNWAPNAVPTTFNDVLIPTAGVTNQPTISAASSSINAMTIQASRVLTINSSLQLSTAANITTAGTIAGAGKLAFSGLTFTQDGLVSIASVEFGAGSHSLTGGGAFASGIVTVLGGASVSLTSNHSLSVLVINGGGSFDCTNRTLTLTGAGTAIFNSGSFTATGSTIIYQGLVAQVVTANIAYNNLTINNAAGVSLAADSAVSGVLNLATDLTTGAFTLTMPASGSSIGSGDVIGNVKRTGFATSVPLSFGNPLNTIRFDSGTPPSDVTMNLTKSTPPGFPFNTVSRTYTITPNGGAGFSATMRLRYKDSELNGLTESSLELWRFNGSSWQSPAGDATRDASANWVEETGISAFSPWAIAGPSGPTLVELISFVATQYDTGTLLEWKTGLETDNLGFNVYREHAGQRSPVNTQLIAGSALTMGASLQSGQNYAWWDKEIADCGSKIADCRNAAYWLEDVDLKGESTWHGPFYPSAKGGTPPARSNAALLSEISNRVSQSFGSHAVEALASVTAASKQQQIVQASLVARSSAKLSINREGWYQVSQRELASVGFDTRVDPRLLQLFVDGRELPIFVRGEQDGFFDPDDSVEFYGVTLDSPFTDSRTYWLTTGSQPGSRIPVDKSSAAPAGDRSFTSTVERRERSIYFSALRNGDRENFFGSVVAANPVDQQLNLTHVAQTDVETATLEVALQGVTFSPHRVRVELNGIPAGEISFAAQSQSVATFSVPHSLLREGTNVVRLVAIGGTADISLVDYVRIAYQHTLSADNDSLKLTAAGNHSLTIDGFPSKSIRVFDVTNSSAPHELTGEVAQADSGYSVTFVSPEPGDRAFLAVTAEHSSARVSLDQPSSLRSHPADLIIITRREFSDSLSPLVALRQSQGLSVTIADIQDIYDEFSFGEKSPFAVRDYLQFAASNWKKPPRFGLFAGDASYDPKNYLGFGDGDLVPTRLVDTDYMETASDDWFADFDNDGVADLAIGRLPIRTPEEAALIVSKIVGYEATPPSREVLLAADENDGFDFEASSGQLRSLVPTSLTVTQINRGRVGIESAKKNLLEGIYRGQKIVNYVGHGSVDQWRAGLLTSEDAMALENQRLPVFILMTCLNGFFDEPARDSLAESLIRAEHGAVAVWASSGMTPPGDQAAMNRELYRQLFNQPRAITLGEAIMRAKSSITDPDIRRTWVLIGDPTMKIE